MGGTEAQTGEIHVQRQLSEYLQCELHHLLGAYGVAEERLRDLADRMRRHSEAAGSSQDGEPPEEGSGSVALARLVEMSHRYNNRLCWYRDASIPRDRSSRPIQTEDGDSRIWPAREPLPDALPLTDEKRFKIGPRDRSVNTSRKSPWASDEEWDRIPQFYREAIAALESHRRTVGTKRDRYVDRAARGIDDEANQRNFARSLIATRDGASDWKSPRAAQRRLERRLNRYENRLRGAIEDIGSTSEPDDSSTGNGRPTPTFHHKDKFLDGIINDDLTNGDNSLPVFVLQVHAEAHLSMHAVEAWHSMCLGEQANAAGDTEREWLDEELDRSIALSTFAYCASRTAPWIFAKSDVERESVIRDVSSAWENVVPTRCMWIASQVELLSLHRRAYARALKGDPGNAYNDYHKLQHLIRDTERRVREAPIHVDGALEFLAGLNAEAHHHIGELYRTEHAHKPALEHFEAASHRLDLLRDEGVGKEVLANSRWHIELQVSRGKACYEMGRHKEALCWHLRALRAFLELLSSETETETNTAALTDAIDWLESVKFEPELRKSEISERIRPVVDQLDRITMVGRVGRLAAEILLRLGHLLFVLNLGYFDPQSVDEPQEEAAKDRVARDRIRSTLAFACLAKAGECDPYSTLVATDLLKTRFRFNSWWGGKLPAAYGPILDLDGFEPVAKQWPRGVDDYENLTRVAEYLLLKARKRRFEDGLGKPDEEAADALLARDLLLDLFMSTDSINVRKSQIHRFLMRKKQTEGLPRAQRTPAIEFVCMRRYSSPFPLLPRPSAFRALGGGYFIRLHGTPTSEGETQPYGIVVDPGVDFVENLYRTGYSLSDIDMIVVTHDHVDHLGALDPLLSLIHVRSELLSKQGEDRAEQRKVTVLTSRSVDRRYKKVKKLSSPNSREFQFTCFEALMNPRSGVLESKRFLDRLPAEFEMVAMSSAAGAENEEEGGHRDLSDQPSHGLCVRVRGGRGPSVAITSDTPPPPPTASRRRHSRWRKVWEPALSADVLVVHLGSVPLTELRRMDAFEERGGRSKRGSKSERAELEAEEESLFELQAKLESANPRLQGQVEYAQWLRSHDPDPERDKGAPPDPAGLVGPVSTRWLPPPEHNYLVGLLRWAREYGNRWEGRGANGRGERAGLPPQGLFVVGELSEELGTMRGKIATRLNHRVFDARKKRKAHEGRAAENRRSSGFPYALTADIGLRACVTSDPRAGSRVDVLCTTCNLDTDRAPEERYHAAHDVYEVCVKGENEGVFYNCIEHDPARQDEPAFLEQLERFDIFGR